MEALVANKFGSYNEVLKFRSVDIPTLGSNDVLVKISYSDLNPVDLQKLNPGSNKGGQEIPNAPFVTGFGGSGIVQQVGQNGPRHLLGKQVCFIRDPSRQSGSYASLIAVDGHCVAELPTKVGLRDAATLPVAGLTAFECLVKLGLITDSTVVNDAKLDSAGSENSGDSSKRQQETFLIVGGSGGVGSWAITLARAYNPNLKIIATASTEQSQAWCQSIGASQVINHDDIARTLKGGREGSVEHVMCLTEPTSSLFTTLTEVIKPYGNIMLVVAGASIGNLDLGFCFFKCANVLTETVFSSIRTNYQQIVPANELTVILKLLDNQTIRAPIAPVLNMEDSRISEKFKDALDDNKGVLSILANTNKNAEVQLNRCGNFVMAINA